MTDNLDIALHSDDDEIVAPGVKRRASGAVYIFDEEAYQGLPVKGNKDDGPRLPDLLEDYVAPAFDRDADYEESHVHGRKVKETVVMFDADDEVTIDPTLARIEAERLLDEAK